MTSKREHLTTPNNQAPVLMHSCCAPCAAELMEAMVESKIPYSIFFYNPNIHPKKEYEIRKQENIRFAQNITLTLSMLIMIQITGLNELRVKNTNPNVANVAQHALI